MGISEIILILLLAIVFVKPENLKDYIKKFYKTKNVIEEVKEEVQKETSDLKETITLNGKPIK